MNNIEKLYEKLIQRLAWKSLMKNNNKNDLDVSNKVNSFGNLLSLEELDEYEQKNIVVKKKII